MRSPSLFSNDLIIISQPSLKNILTSRAKSIKCNRCHIWVFMEIKKENWLTWLAESPISVSPSTDAVEWYSDTGGDGAGWGCSWPDWDRFSMASAFACFRYSLSVLLIARCSSNRMLILNKFQRTQRDVLMRPSNIRTDRGEWSCCRRNDRHKKWTATSSFLSQRGILFQVGGNSWNFRQKKTQHQKPSRWRMIDYVWPNIPTCESLGIVATFEFKMIIAKDRISTIYSSIQYFLHLRIRPRTLDQQLYCVNSTNSSTVSTPLTFVNCQVH